MGKETSLDSEEATISVHSKETVVTSCQRIRKLKTKAGLNEYKPLCD